MPMTPVARSTASVPAIGQMLWPATITPAYDSLRYVVGNTRANRLTPSGSIANGNAEPDRNINGKNSRLAMAGAVLISRAVLPTSRPSGTSAHAPHK